MGIPNETVREYFDSPPSLPAKSRSATAKQEPRALVVGRIVRRKKLTFNSKPRIEVAHDAQVETILVAADPAFGAEVGIGVAHIRLPVIVYEDALHVLRIRRRIGSGRSRKGIGCNCGNGIAGVGCDRCG